MQTVAVDRQDLPQTETLRQLLNQSELELQHLQMGSQSLIHKQVQASQVQVLRLTMVEVHLEMLLHYRLELERAQELLQKMVQSVGPVRVPQLQTVKEMVAVPSFHQEQMQTPLQDRTDKTLMPQDKETQEQLAMKYLLDSELVHRHPLPKVLIAQLVHQQLLELLPKLLMQLLTVQVQALVLQLVQQLDKLLQEVLVQLLLDLSELELRVKEQRKQLPMLRQETVLLHLMVLSMSVLKQTLVRAQSEVVLDSELPLVKVPVLLMLTQDQVLITTQVALTQAVTLTWLLTHTLLQRETPVQVQQVLSVCLVTQSMESPQQTLEPMASQDQVEHQAHQHLTQLEALLEQQVLPL